MAKSANLNLRLPYKTVKVMIDAENVHLFEAMRHARPLTPSTVSNLHGMLQRGEHFDSTLVLNDITDQDGKKRFRLVDGHHRLEAITRFIKLNPTARVEVVFAVYNHLDEDQEKAVYRRWSKGRRQSLDDLIHVQQADFPILNWMQKDFPARVKIYPIKRAEQGFKFYHLMQAYLLRFKSGGGGTGRHETLERIKRLTMEDYRAIKGFAEDFISAFGQPSKSNPFATSLGISCLAKTFYCNLEELDRPEIQERWASKVSKDPAVRQLMTTQALSAATLLTETMVTAMNRGYRTSLALTPTEYQVQHKLLSPKPKGDATKVNDAVTA